MDLLLQLAISAATTLVGAAATDAWAYARSGFARLLGRGDQHSDEVATRRLDALQDQVEQAGPDQREQVRQQLLPAWQTRLADLLEEDPALAEAVRDVRDGLQSRLPRVQQQWVQNVTASATGASAYGVSGGDMFINQSSAPAPVGSEDRDQWR